VRIRVCLLLAVIACTGATCDRMQRAEAPAADADPLCYRKAIPSLDPLDTGVRWSCDPNDPKCWDELANRVLPELVAIAANGERSRQLCAGFITDLKQRGRLRSPKP
jgi:hypothetical protein